MFFKDRSPPARLAKALERVRGGLDHLRRKSFPASVTVLEMVTSHWLSQAIIVAAELEVAEQLTTGPKDIAEIAQSVSAHPDALYRVLRLLSANGIFQEVSPRRFAMTTLARPLLKGAPDSVHGMCVMNGRPFHWNAWGGLRDSVRTGKSAVELQQGLGLFDFLAQSPVDSQVFDEAMSSWVTQSARAVSQAFDFSQFKLIADIGGGRGRFLATLLRLNPTTTGLLFDQAHVVREAKAILDEYGVSARCRVEAGSFFAVDSLPTGADAYILKNIIHDWNDEQAIELLTNIRSAMTASTKLLLVETVVPEGNRPHAGKLIDLEMLVCTPGGKERTAAEFNELLVRAGLKLAKIHAAAALESIVEAVKA